MAFARSQLWLAEYRAPADDFKFLHLLQINGTDDPDFMARALSRELNPDARVEGFAPVGSPTEVAERGASLLASQKGYRPIQRGERRMTKAEVDAARKELGRYGPGGGNVNQSTLVIPSPEEVDRIQADAKAKAGA